MFDLVNLALGLLALIAGVLGGVLGFGTTIILAPLLVFQFGVLQTVPIIAITALVANASRILIWWRVIDWRATGVYSLTAVPAVALGANTLVQLDERFIEILLGVFLILLIPIRRWMRARQFTVKLWQMAIVGAGIGYLTGIVATTGAVNTPFFLAYGLSKGAYLGTEAASSLFVYLTKGIVFHSLGVINAAAIMQGLWIGVCVFVGSLLSKRIILALPEKRFLQIMELTMLISGGLIVFMAVWAEISLG